MLNHSGPFCLPKDIFKKSADVSRLSSANGKPSLIRRLPSRSKKNRFRKKQKHSQKNERPGVIQPQAFAKQKLNNFYPSAVNSRAKLFLTTVHIPGDTFRLKPSRKSI